MKNKEKNKISEEKKVSISTENLMMFLKLNHLEKYCEQSYKLYMQLFSVKSSIA